MEINIRAYLLNLKNGDPLYLYPNPGNAGDALIGMGTIHLLDQLNIPYKLVNDKDHFDPSNKTIMYSGGGNLVKYYVNARNFIETHHKKIKKLIILPHTINAHEDLLSQLGDNVNIIAREKYTFNFLKKYAGRCNIFLAHDMAFYLNKENLLKYNLPSFRSIVLKKLLFKITHNPEITSIPSPKILLTGKILESKACLYRITHKKRRLKCFRIDPEKTGIAIPRNNIDLSEVYKLGTEHLPLIYYSAFKILNFVQKYDEVYTNRLHIAIVGAILNKKTYFYPNSYFKNKAVYEYSLKNRFPNVTWRE